MAKDLAVDLGLELAKFRDHEFDKLRSDPDATFRNWLRNAQPRRAGVSKAFNRAEDQLQAQLQRVADLEAEEALERVEA
jgi:hypothetical protein